MLSSWLWRVAAVTVAMTAALPATAFASTPTPTPSRSAPPLAAQLVTAADLPAGWSAYPSSAFDSGLPACLAKIYKAAPHQRSAAEASFGSPDGSTSFEDRLVRLGKGAAARTTSLETSVASCPTSSAGPLLRVRAIKFAPIGRQSRAFEVTFGLPGTTRVYAIIVFARQGDTVVATTHASMTSGRTQAIRLARLAIKRAA